MKKYIYIMQVLMIVMLFSCKKEHSGVQPQTSDKRKYAVSFNLNIFAQQIIGSNSKLSVNSLVSDNGSIRAMFDSIVYAVLDSTGHFLHKRMFNAKTYTASAITDSLVKGKYTIAIYAGKEGFNGYSYGSAPGGGGNPGPPYAWDDTFGKTFQLTVTGSNISQSVTIERIVAKVNIKILDNIPSNAYMFAIEFNHDYREYNIYTAKIDTPQLPWPNGVGSSIPDSAKNKPNYTISFITLNTITPFTMTVTCSEYGGKIISQRVFDPISVQKNEELTLSGYFFGGSTPTSNGWQVAVNHTWDPSITIKPF